MRIKRLAGWILLALALLGLTGGLIHHTRSLARYYTGIGLRTSDAPIPEKKLKRAMEQEDGDLALLAAWTRGRTTAVAGEDLGLTTEAWPIAVYGDVRQICPMELLSGGYPAQDDSAGCLVTADVAMALFHSPDAVGARLVMNGKRYVVRGVASAYEPMVIVRAEGAAYENLEFAREDPSGGAGAVAALLYRHGLSGAYVTVESGLYARMLAGLAWLPTAMACLLAAGLLMKACKRRVKSFPSLWRIATAAGLLLLALVILKNTLYWPQVYLPTRCSDFGFWGELVADWRESWKAMTLATPLPKDVQFYQAARLTVAGTALALLLEARLYRRVHILMKTDGREK